MGFGIVSFKDGVEDTFPKAFQPAKIFDFKQNCFTFLAHTYLRNTPVLLWIAYQMLMITFSLSYR